MSQPDDNVNNLFFNDLKADMEKMRRQKTELVNLLIRLEKGKIEMLRDIKPN